MAKTSLLRSIVQIANACRRAQTQNISADDLLVREADGRKPENSGGWSRRHFLQSSAVAAAALAMPRWATAAVSAQPRIAIVGAGISGLNCALTLADAGLSATVYEASGRIGGRMFSNAGGYWANNQVTEWGGELIDTGHVTVQALASRFGLPLDDLLAGQPLQSTDTFYFDGNYYLRSQLLRDFRPVYRAVQNDANAAGYPTTYASSNAAGRALDELSVWHWIETRVPGGHASPLGQLLDAAYAIEYGADTTAQSALNLVYLLSGSDRNFEVFGASDERFHVRGGNQQIPAAIASALAAAGQPVQTGMKLLAIRQRADGTSRLTFDSNGITRDVIADLVVLTLPFAVLRTLDYSSAGFDALKTRAIENLGRGHSGKLQLQFSRRLWNSPGTWGISTGSTYADTGYQNTWEATRAQGGQTGILNNFTGGQVSDQMNTTVPFAFDGNTDVRRDALRFLQQVSPVFPGVAGFWNGKVTSSLPHLSPFFNCSYSFWRVGQYQRIAGYEGVRQGNILFAGEHTSQDFQGYMEGGASEGARAAQEILVQLGRA